MENMKNQKQLNIKMHRKGENKKEGKMHTKTHTKRMQTYAKKIDWKIYILINSRYGNSRTQWFCTF